MGTIDEQLLQSDMEGDCFEGELYEPIVYGDSHRDDHPSRPMLILQAAQGPSPGTDAFRPLVVTYLTAIEGGELVLRHKNHRWEFDANAMTAAQPSPHRQNRNPFRGI